MKNSHYSILLLSLLTILSLHTSPSFSEKCHPNDKKALLKIKKELNNPYVLISWDPKTDCCQWGTLKCDPTTNRIVNFVITGTDLNRPFPPTVGDLIYLEDLAFHHTNLTGQIPPSISNLTKLTFLDFRYNNLTGPVPSFLSKLRNLTYIGLAYNKFSGEIPASIATMPNLSGLRLDRNQLTGRIPDSFGSFKQQDFYMYLSHNQLSGEVPRAMGYANYSWIDASRNRLEGDVSFLLGRNKSIEVFDFSRNMLDFDLSDVEVPDSLSTLDLNHNMVRGRLPEGLTRIDGFFNLNVSYNRLCGEIPVGGRLQEFDYIVYFHNRCLCGAPLPACK